MMRRLIIALGLALPLLLPFSAEAALTDNIVSYWKLDGNSNDAVGSKNGSDTSISYSTGNGIINQGAGLSSGSSSNISFGNGGIGSLLSGTSAATVAIWIKPSSRPSAGNRKVAFSSEIASNNAGMIIGLINTNQVEVGGRSKSTDSFQSVTYTDGTGTGSWLFLVGIYDYTNKKISIYYNGTLVVGPTAVTWGQTTFGYAATPSVPDAIGTQNASGYFDGGIDEVGIWNRALSSTEITQLYNSGTGFQYPFILSSCPYAGSGDWTVKYSDKCVINSTVTLPVGAKLNIIRDGTGSFGVTTGGLVQALSGAVILRPGSNVLLDSTTNGAVFNTL